MTTLHTVTVKADNLLDWLDNQEGGALYPLMTEGIAATISLHHDGQWITFYIREAIAPEDSEEKET